MSQPINKENRHNGLRRETGLIPHRPRRQAFERRGSVLVLVVTLLGILFVVGVAFLATMNFEADMIAATRDRTLSESGVDSAVSDATTILRNSVMAGPGIPFGDSSAALSGSAFAELPGVHNSFSPIEPIRRYGADQAAFTPDDTVVFNGYFDAQAHGAGATTAPTQIPAFYIDSSAPNGAQVIAYTALVPGVPAGTPPTEQTVNLLRCADGPRKGEACTVPADCQTTPGPALYMCEGQKLADADGDGIVDSLLVDAKSMGLSDAQLADLAAKVNPATNLGGRVSVALRVIPHGGMVNLNESHPRMIQTVFDIPDTLWPIPTDTSVDPNLGFRHGPTQDLVAYSPTLEEQLLRRRGMIPSRQLQPSLLHGSALAANANATGAHMPRQLFWWSRASGQQDVFPVISETAGKKGHRFTPFTPTELYPDEPNFYYWSVMMEPTTANQAAAAPPPWNAGGTDLGYDRRHLVTTISHDDLLARSSTVATTLGDQDLRRAMIEANRYPPLMNAPECDSAVPFEYIYYPARGLVNKSCCKEDSSCMPTRLEGQMQLSLPWIDEELAAASVSSLSPAEQQSYRERIYRVIHDVFFMLVRNATQATAVEGMACQTDDDCPYVGTICLRDNNVPPDPPGYFLPDQKGTCVYELNAAIASFTNSDPSMPTGCLAASCGVPESLCGDDGICRLAAPAWRDVECPAGACSSGEFCRLRCVGGANAGEFCLGGGDCPGGACGPGGLCADNLTRQPRSQALLSRTAASLTANLIDYADSNNEPTRIALRDFDFSKPYTAGREIDVNTVVSSKKGCNSNADCDANAPVCSVLADPLTAGRMCIKPVYVFGLERQPFITEVTTLAEPADPWPLVGWAVELINPYDFPITLTNDYFIVQAPAGALTLNGLARVPLNGAIPLNDQSLTPGPFSVVYSIANAGFRDALLSPVTGPGFEISGLDFENNATIYLVRRVQYPNDTQPTEIVVDQIVVGQAGGFIGKSGTDLSALNPSCMVGTKTDPPCRFSVQRVVPNLAGLWTSPIPDSTEVTEGEANLGTWNNVRGINPNLHPVQVDFANTGSFGISTSTTALPAYPTTGSMLAIMRHANRSVADYVSPNGANPELSFGSNLVGTLPVRVTYRDQASGLMAETPVNFTKEGEIDNGRLPIFDVGPIPTNNNFGLLGMHHLQPALFKAWDAAGTNPNLAGRGIPGDLNTLPWGQLIFDYFTALPLSNGGPYDIDSAGNYLSIPEVPRVDRDGLRVHGRLNINAAPWKALAGLPLVPMDLAAGSPFTVSFQGLPTSIRDRLNGILDPSGTGAPTIIGEDLAKAIVAYRDARSFNDNAGNSVTGNYNYEFLVSSGVGLTTGRGWTNQLPAYRRGTGFMSVGELANVRHPGSAVTAVPPAAPYRIDSGEIDNQPTANRNDQDFLTASALLMAMGDWVSVRSHVFTVYGQIRGADDPDVAALYPNPAEQAAALIADTDARAIRFQETIDRFPVLEGRARPQRIGERTVGSYTDVNND